MKVILVAIFALALTAHADEPNHPPNVHTNGGRFQLIQLSNFRMDQFLLDTQTGQIWDNQCLIQGSGPTDCQYNAWMKIDVEGVNISQPQIFKKEKNLEEILKNKSNELRSKDGDTDASSCLKKCAKLNADGQLKEMTIEDCEKKLCP